MPRTVRIAPGGMVFHVLNRGVARMQLFDKAESMLSAWPIERPSNWTTLVNAVETEAELESLRKSVQRGRPFGQPDWQKTIAKRLGLESACRPTGRPKAAGAA